MNKLKLRYVLLSVMGGLCRGSGGLQLQHTTFVLCECVHTCTHVLSPAAKWDYTLSVHIIIMYWCTQQQHKTHIFICCFFSNTQIHSNCLHSVAALLVCSLRGLCLCSNGSSVARLCTASTDSCDVLDGTDRCLSLTLRLLIRIQPTFPKYPSITFSIAASPPPS